MLLVTLWLAGGASRGEVLGQVVVRGVCWALLAMAALFVAPPSWTAVRPVLFLLCAAFVLALVQLIPLPPNLWQALPGRAPFLEAAAASGQSQPWRPWSIVPGATANAAASLVVPFTTLFFMASLGDDERSWLPGVILALITGAMLVGLLQFSGANLANPLINDSPGEVGGTFANRNHFALFVAFGCLLAPVWAFLGGRQPHWRGPVAIALVLLFVLTILATGSRAGMGLGALGIAIGLALTRGTIKRTLARYPRWVFPAIISGVVATTVLLVAISIAADRAISIERALTIDPGQDMRSRGLPTVWAMVWEYFPAGSGLGGFDPLFRMHEPFALLKFTFFNHAHNDLLEVVLDAGLPGLLLLLAALGWWITASVHAWRAGDDPRYTMQRLGSAILLFVVLASVFDYPARTPMMMAMIIVAGVWLSGAPRQESQHKSRATSSALPSSDQHL
ncbi:O-antigen ligase family protein [Sphingomonas sp. SUN019]|uniref:O-antigen ligase family protein n=1 Tax=Sphingomonas sp. SUN019 TaxID=2937788 RepID=UPI0021646B82|nr:O-antigen ligase family protein [Sphingomonas sp. SUN019]UVO50919.1 O-antigen ligase family protein [Sphingomonas sp. SUN019]